MDSHKPNNELSIRDTLSGTFEIYASHLVIFLIPFLIGLIITGSFSSVMSDYASSIPSPDPTQPLDVHFAELAPHLTNLIILARA